MVVSLTILERLLHRLHLLPTPVMDAFGGMIFGRVLTVAVRRGMFEKVASGPRSVQEIAEETGFHADAVALMTEAFVVSGYMLRKRGMYLVSDEGRKWLVRSSPFYLGNLVLYFETLYGRWSEFEYALDHGSPKRPYFSAFTDADWRTYVYGMRDLARLMLNEIRSKLILRGNSESLLDLGGSHGLYAIEFCRRDPALRATVMDFEPALVHTREIARAEGMFDRVSTLAGDFTNDPLPSHQDCVLMFNIVHGLTEEVNKKLVKRVHAALKPGGKVFLLDQMKDRRHRSRLATFMPLMVGLNLLNEIGGNVYDVGNVKHWFSGFSSVTHYRLRLPGVTLLEAVR